MLAELEIVNYALVEKAVFSFSSGLNILTGETGAGKSLIVDAVGFLLGSPLRDKPLRQGASSGRVSARFTDLSSEVLAYLQERGLLEESPETITSEDSELIISRDIKASGRSLCRVNQHLVSVAMLRDLAALLVDLHGQHQQYALLSATGHLRILDKFIAFGNPAYPQLLENYAKTHKQVRSLAAELEQLRDGERGRLREIDWAIHEIAEIEQIAPQIGEDEVLASDIKRISSAAELQEGAWQAHELLSGEQQGGEKISAALAVLRSLAAKDEKLAAYGERLAEAEAVVNDCVYELRAYAESIGSDAQELESLQERWEQLRKLQRKYGPSLQEVMAYCRTAKDNLQRLQSCGVRSEELENQLALAKEQHRSLAGEISQQRAEQALLLKERVESELVKVGMPLCRFSTALTPLNEDNWTSSGADGAEFLIAPNPGEEARPLAKIASGGELSRIMLALLSLFSRFQQSPTLFFDEIDAGLGGRAAEAVAKRLRSLAESSQVVCVTHLAVLAAAGQRQHHLFKEVCEGRTSTHVEILEGQRRELEIARMLSGDATPEQSLLHARHLLTPLDA